jgi:2-keto-4-pentenoate hydratase/2-oxohepta-3-ene-1,7-dioic acid hydratase in catechol pathway
MRLLTFEHNRQAKLGALNADGDIVDVLSRSADPRFSSMLALIEAGPEALAHLETLIAGPGAVVKAHSVKWLAPLPVPVQMRDFVAFEQHMRIAGWNGAKLRARWGAPPAPPEPPPVPPIWYAQPLYYKCNRFATTGPDSTVNWPDFSEVIDYELEIACVIGTGGRDISEANARAHIFGYTIFNDLTARDAQFREMQGPFGPAKGKDFDQANVLGPLIVTADELEVDNLAMRARVNDELWSEGSSAGMHWSFADMIAHVSRCETLRPGEILASGTVSGGCGLELGRFLKHNDVIELEVQGIGRLSTRIIAPHVPIGVTL